MAKTTNNLPVSDFPAAVAAAPANARVVDLAAFRERAGRSLAPQATSARVFSMADHGAQNIAKRRSLVRNQVLDIVLDAESPPIASVTLFLSCDGTIHRSFAAIEPEMAKFLVRDLEDMTAKLRYHASKVRTSTEEVIDAPR